MVDEVFLYNRALSEGEVTALYTSCGTRPTAPCPNMVDHDAKTELDLGWENARNPNGVWSYGWSTGLGGTLHLFADRTDQTQLGCSMTAWYDTQNWYSTIPFVERNTGGDCSDSNITYYTGALIAHPGGLNFTAYAHVVFTAPADGYYYVSGGFFAQQNGIDVDVNAVVDGVPAYSKTLTANGAYRDLFRSWALANGETLDFAVGPDFSYSPHPGSTRVEARVSACVDATGQVPTCTDSIRNQDESDVDCGGAHCPSCDSGRLCTRSRDCTSGTCLPAATGSGLRCLGDQIRTSCQAYVAAGLNAGDGQYTIDPDGSGPNAPFEAYCDMTQHHGGWVLVGKLGGAVQPAAKGALTVDRNVGRMLVGDAIDPTEFSTWSLGRFDAWGRTWTIRTNVDADNDGSEFQYTFFRPSDGQSVLPSVAGSNWQGSSTNTLLVHLVMASTAGLANTTWLAVPPYDVNSDEQFVAFGYRVASYMGDTTRQCLSNSGQTQICHVPAGVILVVSPPAGVGTYTAAFGYADGVTHQYSRRATYWIKDVNADGTP